MGSLPPPPSPFHLPLALGFSSSSCWVRCPCYSSRVCPLLLRNADLQVASFPCKTEESAHTFHTSSWSLLWCRSSLRVKEHLGPQLSTAVEQGPEPPDWPLLLPLEKAPGFAPEPPALCLLFCLQVSVCCQLLPTSYQFETEVMLAVVHMRTCSPQPLCDCCFL